MTFEEYLSSGRPRYAELAKVVESILAAAIKRQPSFRLQHTQRRAKEKVSLQKKLQRDGNFETTELEAVVKDLAGCRLVFYTNSDVSAFLSSSIVRDNFDVDWDRTKIHHPSQSAANAADLFVSNNYVVRLKPDRAVLPEYTDVAGLWCEVQVQTTLNHAWAEMAHDTIYKKSELPGGFGDTLMRSIEDRMGSIMREYLLPAGYEFQKVLTDFERLSSGRELFDRGALKALTECHDNNARYDLLERFTTYVLPNYDDVAGVAPEIRAALVQVVGQARSTDSRAIDTPFGSYPGHTSQEICAKVADIIDRLRYTDVEGTFHALVDLYLGAISDEERERWVKSAEELAENNLFVWKKVGPAVQQRIVEAIRSLKADKKHEARLLLTAMLAKVLSSEATGTSGSFDKITFSRGTVPSSESLKNVRFEAIKQLKVFFAAASDEASQRKISSALNAATRVGSSTGLTDRLRVIVLNDSRNVVDFYTAASGQIGHLLLQHIEHQMLWLYRHNSCDPEAQALSVEVEEARLSLRSAIIAFRDHINRDRPYHVFKILVGYESVFSPAWDDDGFDIEEADKFRSGKIDELVASVTSENEEEWLETLIQCASTKSNDLATFPSLAAFLERLALAKPEIVLGYLSRIDERLADFLPSMLRGLERGLCCESAYSLVRQWVEDGRFLSPIIWSFRSTKKLDVELLRKALDQAIEQEDRVSIYNIVTVSHSRHDDVEGGLIDALLLPALSHLSSIGETRWANSIWGSRDKSLFSSLSESQAKRVLSALVATPRLDWREEEILRAVAKMHQNLVVDFFGERLTERAKIKGDYDAIPFQFYRLHEVLSTNAQYVIQSARRWFSEDPYLFSYRGGRFVSNIFQRLSTEAETELRKLIEQGEEGDVEFVVQVLRNYEGQEFLHELVKEIVERLPSDSELLNEVEVVLDESGVVTGEFGFVELHRNRLQQMQPWLDDARERVRTFAKKHILSLERRIAAEQRRAEEDYEMRKREWGSEDPEDDESS